MAVAATELIAAVRRRPTLWNSDSAEYKHGAAKEAAWREVALECRLADVKEAKATWRRLRDGHRQAITRESSRGAAWKHEQSMSFLLPHMRRRTDTGGGGGGAREYWYADKQDGEAPASEPCEDEMQNFEYASTSELKDDNIKAVDSNSGDAKEDALDKFFGSMLLATRALGERLQLRVQRQVFQAVMQAREEQLAGAGAQTDCFD